MAAYLTVDDVTQCFPLADGGRYVALRDIDLEVREGEFVSLIGHSGCGKSTLLNLMAGLTQASSGGILVDGRQVTEPGPDRMVVFQNYSLLPWQTVRQNISLAVNRVWGQRSASERRQAVDQSLAMVGLSQAADRFPSELSGGMKQRVAIARALSIRPRLLLLDEPFGALDALTRGNLQQQLMQICQEAGVTAVMVTHDVDEALLLSDRVVMMTNGPEAGIGQILSVPFARPRQRLEVMEHPDYYRLRQELIGFLQQQRRLRQRRSQAAVSVGAAVAAGEGAAAAAAVPIPTPAAPSQVRPALVRIGFLPGLDAAPLAMALDRGLFDTAAIEVVPVPFARWDRLEQSLVAGDLQAAFLPATTPLQRSLGLGGRQPWTAITPLTISRNGNAVCLSRQLHERGIRDRDSLASWLREEDRCLTLGVPQHFGIAELLLRHWLAAADIDLSRRIRFEEMSPLVMPGALRTERIDGFIAGRYRVAEAVENRVGVVLASDVDIWDGHPEKVLCCGEDWADAQPEALEVFSAGLLRASLLCDDGGQREALVRVLSQSQWLGSSARYALSRRFHDGSTAAGANGSANQLSLTRFHADRANVPNPADGCWLLSQFCRWQQCAFPLNRVEILSRLYRQDLCNRAMERAGLAILRPDRHPFLLADGLAFDQDEPLAYLADLGLPRPAQATLPLPEDSSPLPLPHSQR
ncbi:MAG: nitrate ABC transporter ATP-binding protein [Synechococcaceae cyanobacterium]|nr:nitrate ABC transporter ATP-binding protein [Synechococcaceae cyanobacterium]